MVQIRNITRPSERRIEITKGEHIKMSWVGKDDVKERCSLFDILGARLAKYVNDEVRDAQLVIIDEIEYILKDGRAVTARA